MVVGQKCLLKYVVLLNWCMIDMKKYCIHILYNYVHVYDKMNGYA